MMDREVKTEVLSPPSTSSFRSSPDGPTSTKKLDPIDKWRSRVLFCGRTSHGDEEESWSKRIEKQVAVLRVAFPFLTDKQIQGKAWQSCGLNSVMGGVPRHGLSPGVKREFTKHKIPYRCTMSQRSKVKKEPIKIEKVDKKFAHCPYTFASPTGQLLTPQSIIENLTAQNALVANPFSKSQEKDSSPTSGDDLPPSRSAKKRKRQTNKKATNMEFDNPVSATQDPDIIPGTPVKSIRTTSPFCSQPLNLQVAAGLNNIIPSLTARSNYFTQAHISECSSTVQSNTEKTQSGLDQEFPKSSQVVNPYFKTVEPEEASVPPTMHTPENFFITPKNQNITQREIDESQIDSDPTVSGLNNLSAGGNSNSITNYFCSSMTPNRNAKTLDAKKKITFETVAEVYHSDSYVPEKKNDIGSKCSINLNLHEEEGTIRAASPTENIENSQMCTPKNLHYMQQKEIRSSKNFSMDVDTDVDHANQDSNKQVTINPMNNNSPINTNLSRVTSASCHLSEKASELHQSALQRCFQHYANQVSSEYYQEFRSFTQELSIPVSLPTTPKNPMKYVMPDSVLLSNYSSEYEKAYTKKDLNPSTYRNYYSSKMDESLKNYFDQVIPSDQYLQTFFNASDRSFKKVHNEVRRKVNYILLHLEENESGENY